MLPTNQFSFSFSRVECGTARQPQNAFVKRCPCASVSVSVFLCVCVAHVIITWTFTFAIAMHMTYHKNLRMQLSCNISSQILVLRENGNWTPRLDLRYRLGLIHSSVRKRLTRWVRGECTFAEKLLRGKVHRSSLRGTTQ